MKVNKLPMILMLLVLTVVIPACPAGYYGDRGSNESPAVSERGASDSGETLPLLLDLGSTHCVPCQQMAPILEEMKAEYEGVFNVQVIDVSVDRAAGQQYRVTRIPLQIYFDAGGNELFRHVGFYSKDDMLAKWVDLGYNFEPVNNNSEPGD